MSPNKTILKISWITLLAAGVFLSGLEDAQARPAGGGRGRSGGFSRSGVASSGSFGAGGAVTRPSGGGVIESGQRRPETADRQTERQIADPQTRQQTRQNYKDNRSSRDVNPDDWKQYHQDKQDDRQEHHDENREDWQNYGQDRQQDRQDFIEDHDDYRYRYPAAPYAAGLLTGMAVGTSLSAVQFSNLGVSCNTLDIQGETYYSCGSTWYKKVFNNGQVAYIVVNAPQ